MELLKSPRRSEKLRKTLLGACTLACTAGLVGLAWAGESGFVFSGQLFETVEDAYRVATVAGETHYVAKLYLRLYDDSEGAKTEKGQALWGRCVTVNVQNGCFACDLSDGVGTPIEGLAYTHLADAFAHLSGNRISVGVTAFSDDNDEITPRQTLTSVPYAVCAHDARGSLGDLTVPGTLSAASVSAKEAVFAGTVTHEGTVRLKSRQEVPKLVLDDGRTFAAAELIAGESVVVTNATIPELRADTVSAAVREVGVLEAADLVFEHSATVGKVSQPTGGDEIVVNGDVGSKAVTVTDLEVGSPISLFNWSSTFKTLPGNDSGVESQTYYSYNEQKGWWKPTVQDVFISLSFLVGGTDSVTVSVDDRVVAEISVRHDMASGWVPFQTFVKKGQTISWTGANHPLGVLMTCREFSY